MTHLGFGCISPLAEQRFVADPIRFLQERCYKVTSSIRWPSRIAVLAVIAAVTLSSCAAGPNTAAETGTDTAGFWLGLWQGFILPITFVISLFNQDVNIYEIHNNGGWYNFGFILGACSSLGGSGRAGSCRRRAKDAETK